MAVRAPVAVAVRVACCLEQVLSLKVELRTPSPLAVAEPVVAATLRAVTQTQSLAVTRPLPGSLVLVAVEEAVRTQPELPADLAVAGVGALTEHQRKTPVREQPGKAMRGLTVNRLFGAVVAVALVLPVAASVEELVFPLL